MLYTLVGIDESMNPALVEQRKGFIEADFPQVTDFCSLDKYLSGGRYILKSHHEYPYLDSETGMVTDLNFLKNIQSHLKDSKILGAMKKPNEEKIAGENTANLLGFDILDKLNHYSLLTNCGGFPELFANSELNVYALLDDLGQANHIRNQIRFNYSEDFHCKACEVWAIFKVT